MMPDDPYDRLRERDATGHSHYTEQGYQASRRMVPISQTPAGRNEEPDTFGDEFPETTLGTMSLRELLLGDINRLRYTWRFNMSLTAHRENVAEHSYFVAVYAFWLVSWVETEGTLEGQRIDMQRVLITALFHDAEESRTGDFSRLFKHSHPELRAVIEKYAALEFDKVASAILPQKEALGIVRYLQIVWAGSKDKSPEGCIIALADFLSVFSHMWQEVNTANATMLTHYDTMLEYLHKFDGPEFDFLRPVINDVQRLVRRVLGDKELRRRLEVK